MFERFTERARQVITLGQEEARGMKHNFIGTEHLLLGLLRESDGVGAKALIALGVNESAVRDAVRRIQGEGTEPVEGQIPFTPRTKKVCELALREALSLGHNYIGTEHILLALGRENEGVSGRILSEADVDDRKIRNEIVRLVSGHGGTSNEDRWHEYEVCKKRGHEATPAVLTSNPPKHRCRHCGTVFWTEVVQRESGAPIEPKVAAA